MLAAKRGAAKKVKLAGVELHVSGRVQRVGYRSLVERAAGELGVAGYVENKRDGSVRILAEGTGSAIERFVRAVSQGKGPVLVAKVERKEVSPTGRYRSFTIRPGRLVDEIQEGLGAGQEQLAELTGEFRGFRGDFDDYRGEFRSFRGDFDDYRGEFRNFADRTDGNFKELGGRYDAISEKLSTIMAEMAEQSKKTNELLDSFRMESKESRERLDESIRLLREAVERIRPAGSQPA